MQLETHIFFITTLFKKRRMGYCYRLRPSRYLLLNHWTKSNQIWCVCCSHVWGVQQHFFLAPPPGEGPKGQILLNIKFQLQSQFQIFLNQTLCVYSQIKYIKHIRPDFHLAAWGHDPGVGIGGTMEGWGGGGGQKKNLKFNQSWCVSYLHEWHLF